MQVLHILSNWKWTERAEPAADLAAAQACLGARVWFACGRRQGQPEDSVEWHAVRKGLSPLVLNLKKHFGPVSAWSAIRHVREFVRREKVDVVHAHMPNAHLIGVLAAARLMPAPVVVASCYDPDGPQRRLRPWWLYRFGSDGAIAITGRARDRLVAGYGLAPGRVRVIEPGIDVQRFASSAPADEARARFGIADSDRVVGIVSRIRRSRRLDVVFEAVAQLAGRIPNVRILVVGRGSAGAVEKVLGEPARRLGLGRRVVQAGYCRDQQLVSAYRAMDVLAYPVPGTDGSCRTVREAMAAGVPVVASRIGFLPQLVEDGVTGRLADLSAGSFAEAIGEILRDESLRSRMALAAAETANNRFALELQARRTLEFYEQLLRSRGGVENAPGATR